MGGAAALAVWGEAMTLAIGGGPAAAEGLTIRQLIQSARHESVERSKLRWWINRTRTFR